MFSGIQSFRRFATQVLMFKTLWEEVFQQDKMLLLLLLSRFSRVRLCVTPIDGSLPGSSIHGISQARVLEWGAMAFSTNTN